jgi:hypothetical protein
VENRAAAYRDGVRAFVLGYREAFRDAVLEEGAERAEKQAARGQPGPDPRRSGGGGDDKGG